MEREKLGYYRDRLLEKKKKLADSIRSIEEGGIHVSMQDSFSELSLYDNHPADIGSELFERGKDLALRDQAIIELKKVEEALVRVGNGSYGLCISCHQPINEERLKVIPEASWCKKCRQDLEGQGNLQVRPIEEGVISPPFGGSKQKNEVQFDGEDSWQAVARYGSSDTPSDLGEEYAQYPNIYQDWDEDRGTVEDVEETTT
ncbi:MAG: TraR/DksA C4-type zinc finger protein [Bacillota bacterium]